MHGSLACGPSPTMPLSCSTKAGPLIDLGEWAQCGVGWDAGLLGVLCSCFSQAVVYESLGCALASFLRCGCLVPINSCGRLGFFNVVPSVCWLVAAAELVERGFDCCEGCFFRGSVLLQALSASSGLLRYLFGRLYLLSFEFCLF